MNSPAIPAFPATRVSLPMRLPLRKSRSSVLAWASLGVVYAALALFIYPDWINVGLVHGVEEANEFRFLSLPTPDIAFVLLIGFALATDNAFRLLLFGRIGIAFFGVLFAYSLLGIVFGNDTGWLREDLRIWMWCVAGVALVRLLMKTRRPCFHILAICLLAGTVLLISALAAQSGMDNNAYLINDRVWDLNVFNYAGMMIVFLGLVLGLCAQKHFVYLAGSLAALGMFFYAAVIASATRSLTFGLLLVCILALPALVLQRNPDVIGLRLRPSALWVGLLFGLVVLLVVATFAGLAFTNSTMLADRWNDTDIDSGLDRFVELGDALRQLGLVKAVVGGGLGFSFESIFDYTAFSLHIGVFVFLLKFGVFPFLAIAFGLYVFLPYKYVQALVRPRSLPPPLRTALLVTLPGMLGWVLILSMSGGYDHYYFVGVGVSLGVFNEVRLRGLREICR